MLNNYLEDRAEGPAAAEVLHLHQPVRHQLHAGGADGRDGAPRSHAGADGAGVPAGSHPWRLSRRDVRRPRCGVDGKPGYGLLDRYARGLQASSGCRSSRGGSNVLRRISAARRSRRAEAHGRRVLADPRLQVPRRWAVTRRRRRERGVRGGDQRDDARRFFGDGPALGQTLEPTGSASASSAWCGMCRACASCRSPTSGCR